MDFYFYHIMCGISRFHFWIFPSEIRNVTILSFRIYIHISKLEWNYLWNGMWCIIIIITTGEIVIYTVGYGDYYARTLMGRIIVFFTCLMGPFLISVMNIFILNFFRLLKSEDRVFMELRKAYFKFMKQEKEINVNENSIVLIQTFYRLYKAVKKRKSRQSSILNDYKFYLRTSKINHSMNSNLEILRIEELRYKFSELCERNKNIRRIYDTTTNASAQMQLLAKSMLRIEALSKNYGFMKVKTAETKSLVDDMTNSLPNDLDYAYIPSPEKIERISRPHRANKTFHTRKFSIKRQGTSEFTYLMWDYDETLDVIKRAKRRERVHTTSVNPPFKKKLTNLNSENTEKVNLNIKVGKRRVKISFFDL